MAFFAWSGVSAPILPMSGVVRHRRAGGEDPDLVLPHGGIAREGLHELVLRHGAEHGLADAGIVEGRLDAVEAQDRRDAGLVLHLDMEVLVAPEQRDHVGRRHLDPIHLARLQRGRRGRGVGHGDPLDAVEMHDLRAGGQARRATRARHVAREFLVHDPGARHALGRDEAERPAADHFADRLVRIACWRGARA